MTAAAEKIVTAQDLRPRLEHKQNLQIILDTAKQLAGRAEIFMPGDSKPQDIEISGITIDSRAVKPGDLYAAIAGAQTHGIKFVKDIAAKAAAIITDYKTVSQAMATGLPVVAVADVRALIGHLAQLIYAGTKQKNLLHSYAVTGTNGKTTTTYMVESLYARAAKNTGLIGTVEIKIGQTKVPSKLTTPEATDVHALLAAMREKNTYAVAMEVSSHALDYGRIAGVSYDIAGFTNLTHDHLDQHKTMQAYFASKAKLFTPDHTKRAVITVDDPVWGQKMYETAVANLQAANVYSLYTGYGQGIDGKRVDSQGVAAAVKTEKYDWWVSEVVAHGIGSKFILNSKTGQKISLETGLPGSFNVSNAALAAVMLLESNDLLAADLLSQQAQITPSVPGRMEVICEKPLTIVDFAHNPDAMLKLMQDASKLRDLEANRDAKLIIVFGATGKRDQEKRPIMGGLAAENADVVIVTDDEPHGEATAPIRAEVLEGVYKACQEGARAQQIFEIAPREKAIFKAIDLADSADVVVFAGRGHETVQELADDVHHQLDDREAAKAALQDKGYTVL